MNYIDVLIARLSQPDEFPYIDDEDREVLLSIVERLHITDLNSEMRVQSELEATAGYIASRYQQLADLARHEADKTYHRLVVQNMGSSDKKGMPEWKIKSIVKDNADYQSQERRASDLVLISELLDRIRWSVLTRFRTLEQISINERQERRSTHMAV